MRTVVCRLPPRRRRGVPAGSWCRPWLLALGVVIAALPSARAVERAELEAAIVYNLLLYVEWPPEVAPAAGGVLVLCVEPGSPLRGPLMSLEGRPVGKLRLASHTLDAGESLRGCHAAFVDAEPSGGRRRAMPRGPALLLIGNGLATPDDGVAIRLAQAEGRLVFDIDLGAAREARLQISSRLLRLARKVSG